MEKLYSSLIENCDDENAQQKYELELVVSGETFEEIKGRTVLALRVAAHRIAAGQLETGFHSIQGRDGHVIGEIYLDHYD